MAKYTGRWSANNGSSYNGGYEDSNKKRLASDMRKIALGNTFAGSTGNWTVCDANGKEVLSGSVRN